MNKRIKSEGAVAKPSKTNVKRTRTAARCTPAKLKKTTNRLFSLAYVTDSSSEEEFQFATPVQKRNNRGRRQSTTLQKATPNVKPSASSYTKRIHKRDNSGAQKVYEVSDSSDDELIAISCAIDSPIETVCLGDTDASSDNITSILDNIIEATNNKQENYCHPSTSKVLPSTTVDITNKIEFIDNLLEKNQDLLDGSYLKSLRELNEQTDKLLETSWDLINKEDTHAVADQSVIYVCTDKDPMRTSAHKNTVEAIEPVVTDLTKTQEQEQQIKAHCPICLESLGTSSVSATTCGHTFCTPCINSCIKSCRKCPTCRKRLTTKMVHPLFLF